jgi:hypothetical protein
LNNPPALFKTKVVVVVVIRTMPLESNVAIKPRACVYLSSVFIPFLCGKGQHKLGKATHLSRRTIEKEEH